MKKTAIVLIVILFMTSTLCEDINANEDVTLSVNTNDIVVLENREFKVSIQGDNFKNLYAFELRIEYDSSKLTCTGGDFDGLSGSGFNSVIKRDNLLYSIYTKLGNEDTESGKLDLCVLNFRGDVESLSTIIVESIKVVQRDDSGRLTTNEYSDVKTISVEVNENTDKSDEINEEFITFIDELISEDTVRIFDNDEDILIYNELLIKAIKEATDQLMEEPNSLVSAELIDRIREIIIVAELLVGQVESEEALKQLVNSIIIVCEPLISKGDILSGRTNNLKTQLNSYIISGSKISVSEEEFSASTATNSNEKLLMKMEKASEILQYFQTIIERNGMDINFRKILTINVIPYGEHDFVDISISKELLDNTFDLGISELALSSNFVTVQIKKDTINKLEDYQSLKLNFGKDTNGLYRINIELPDNDQQVVVKLDVLPGDYNVWDKLSLWYYDDNNSSEILMADFDEKTKQIKFVTNKFGAFGIKELTHIFDDVKADYWGKPYIEALSAKGIISGKTSNKFEPNSYITRAEFVKMIILANGLNKLDAECNFSDVIKDDWCYKYVAIASSNGLVVGYPNGTFGVNDNIKREDISRIIAREFDENVLLELDRFLDYEDNNDISSYALEGIALVTKYGIFKGDNENKLNPKGYATRGEAAAIIYRYMKYFSPITAQKLE